MSIVDDPALSVCFTVEIEGHDLGVFTGCSGLGAELTMEQREEGGNAGFVHQLPGRLKYPNIKLTRPLDADSAKIATWFASMADRPKPSTARITARRSDDSVVATWTLLHSFPVKWSGPELSAETLKPCSESLELAHHGFFPGV